MTSGPSHVNRHVATYSRQPRGEFPRFFQFPEIHKSAREGFLSGVLGKLMVPEDTVGYSHQGGIVVFTERAEAVDVAGLNRFN